MFTFMLNHPVVFLGGAGAVALVGIGLIAVAWGLSDYTTDGSMHPREFGSLTTDDELYLASHDRLRP